MLVVRRTVAALAAASLIVLTIGYLAATAGSVPAGYPIPVSTWSNAALFAFTACACLIAILPASPWLPLMTFLGVDVYLGIVADEAWLGFGIFVVPSFALVFFSVLTASLEGITSGHKTPVDRR